MKYLLAILLMAFVPVGAGGAQEAKHSSFTIDQLAKHLGLGGGNWKVSFDEKCFLGFVTTATSAEGVPTKKYYWSSNPSKEHEFHFMHHTKPKPPYEDLHEIAFSSNQIGELEKEGAVSTRISGGVGFTYDVPLPSNGGKEERRMESSFRPTLDEPTLLYSWKSSRTKEAFQLDIVFAVEIKEAEPTGADQPATKPADKPPVKDQPSTPTPKVAPR